MKKQIWIVLLAVVMAVTLLACVACVDPKPATYTLTYAAGEGTGTAPEAKEYEAGAEITLINNPFTAPANKEFDGWMVEGVKKAAGDKVTMPEKDITITAQWKTTEQPQPEKWTVTFKNEAETVSTVEVVKGQKLTASQIPTLTNIPENKEFAGWFIENTETEVTVDTAITGNIVVVAKLTDKQVTPPEIVPDEAWIGVFDVKAFNEGEPYEEDILTIALSQDGKTLEVTFECDGSEEIIEDVQLSIVQGKQQLSFVVVTVGLGSPIRVTYLVTLQGENAFTFEVEDDDYFDYEITKRGDEPTPPVTEIPEKYNGEWAIVKYTITIAGLDCDKFKIENGKISIHNEVDDVDEYYSTYSYDLTVESNENGVLVLSFKGVGSNSFTATLTFDSDTTCELAVTVKFLGADQTTTEDFVKLTYVTVSFNMGEGYQGTTPAIPDKQVVAQTTTSAPATPVWREYRFLGWFADGAQTAFDFKTPITEDITLTAHWEKIENVTVTFVVEGHDVPSQTVAFGEKITAPQGDFEKDGFQFGWYLGTSTTPFDFDTAIEDDITLTGKWTELFTVTYVCPEGYELTAPQAVQVTKGSKVVLASTPGEIDGYEFKGWFLTVEGSQSSGVSFRKPGTNYYVNANVTLTAVYGMDYSGLVYDWDTEKDKLLTLTITLDGEYVGIVGGMSTTFLPIDGEYEFSQNVSVLVFDEGSSCYQIDKTTKKLQDIDNDLFLFTCTANDGETVLKFDGVDKFMIGETIGTYAFNVQINVATLTINDKTYNLKLKVENDSYVMDGYFAITVDETEYAFGTAPEQYTVNFELGGGTGTAPEAMTVMSDNNQITLPSGEGLANGELVFAGWIVKGDETNTVLKGKYTVTGNVTLVAAWKEAGSIDPSDEPWDQITTDADDSLRILCPDSTLNGVRLYFEQEFTIVDKTFIGVEIIYNGNFTWNEQVGAYRLKVVYSNNGEQVAGAITVMNTDSWSEDDKQNLDPNLLVFSNSTYRVVFGRKGDKFYITEFKYKTNDADTTERVLLTEKPSTTPVEEPADMSEYVGTIYETATTISINGYDVMWITIDSANGITITDSDEESYETSTATKIVRIDGKVVATFENCTITFEPDGLSITVETSTSTQIFTK